MIWTRISLLLCIFGFLKEFRPSESFVTEYLTGHWKNFTEEAVYQEIYPMGTYSYLATLVIVFLVTDFLRYKPIIVLCGLSGSVTYILMILAQTIPTMLVIEFFYGLFLATEVAYYTYIYAKVDKSRYQVVTSHTRVAFLLGRSMAGVTAQLTVSLGLLDYHQLNYLTISGLILATIWALFLPTVDQSVYFHRNIANPLENDARKTLEPTHDIVVAKCKEFHDTFSMEIDPHPLATCDVRENSLRKVRKAYGFLWKDLVKAYRDPHVVKWSIWWAFSTCGYMQVISYIQVLWKSTVLDETTVYNGVVEAIYTILGALAAFGIGKLRLNWPLVGEATLSLFSYQQGILLLIASQSYNIWYSYAAYIIFGIIYQSTITVASSEVAKNLSEGSYGLIFGINTLLALLLQSLLTFVITGKDVFALAIRPQYIVYGSYYIVLGTIFLMMALYTIYKHCSSGKPFRTWDRGETS